MSKVYTLVTRRCFINRFRKAFDFKSLEDDGRSGVEAFVESIVSLSSSKSLAGFDLSRSFNARSNRRRNL